MGRTTYKGFYVDWFIEFACFASDPILFTSSASIYVGLFLYINAMVKDVKMRLSLINLNDSADEGHPANIWSNYVPEIDLHVEIIK